MVKNDVIEYLKGLNADLEKHRTTPVQKPKIIYDASLGGKILLNKMPDVDSFFNELEEEGFWEKYK